MDFLNFVMEQALILVPALFIVGELIKKSAILDKYIPLVLLVLGIVFSVFLLGFNIESVIQGILVTGAAVFVDQVAKQAKR